MGDLLMSSPAIRALKETFDAQITILTSSAAAGIVRQLPQIDDCIVADLPWVKNPSATSLAEFNELIGLISNRNFDLAVIFSVYSQNPLPAAMLAWQAGVPQRLAYSRENPYGLLSHWVPDEEPFSVLKHQVRRDLDLVASIGATTSCEKIQISTPPYAWTQALHKLSAAGVDPGQPWLILHAGVSEDKRQYPASRWIETAKLIRDKLGVQVLFTGSGAEKTLTDTLQHAAGIKTFSVAGVFDLDEFTALIARAPLVISVNTATAHLAAAVATPVIVLYALTNPQHSPWKAKGKVFPFDVMQGFESKNEVIRQANKKYFRVPAGMVTPAEIMDAASAILNGHTEAIPELFDLEKWYAG